VSLQRTTLGAAALVALLLAGCRSGETEPPRPVDRPASREAACAGADGRSDLSAAYRIEGQLLGDVDGDRAPDRVTLRADERRPPACRHVLVVEIRAARVVAAVEPLPWPGTDPQLLLLAEIDGRAGVEPVVALSPAAVYQPGAVFTLRDGEVRRMQLEGVRPGHVFPFADEFPAGVDCADEPGTIVVTFGSLAEEGRDDRHWAVRRSRYRAAGTRFARLRTEELRVEVGPEAKRRWPELRGDPFLSCGARTPPRP
jgi:hypothetical protein